MSFKAGLSGFRYSSQLIVSEWLRGVNEGGEWKSGCIMVQSRDGNDHGMTASVPRDRVDLVEPNQPRVGGKQPNMFVVDVNNPQPRQNSPIEQPGGPLLTTPFRA